MAIYKEYQWEHFQLLIWKLDPEEELPIKPEELSEPDQKKWQKIKNAQRRLEFLSARAALAELLGASPKLSYSDSGAPKLESHQGISLTHNRNYAAAMISKSHQVGLDLEAYRPQMTQLKSRYLSTQELNSLGQEDDLQRLSSYWCAKESLIKLLDAPELDLRKQIRISPFHLGMSATSKALIKYQGKQLVLPLYFKLEKDFCLCFSFH